MTAITTASFNLSRSRAAADLTVEAVRANLDATLRLIDQENPSKSELLTSTLRAHGRGPRPRAIFPGSNDLTYRILATWVQSLHSPKTGAEANRLQAGQPDDGERFAAGRDRTAGDNPEAVMSALANKGRPPAGAGRSARRIPSPEPSPPASPPARALRGQAAPEDFPCPSC